ncbi:MAG: hypothetical protein NVSMB13_14560 [Mycobacteriales bacterium]
MNVVVRRRLATCALATAAAVVVGGVAAPSAFAGAISNVSPNNGFNNNNSLPVTLTTSGLFSPADPTGTKGSVVSLTRANTTTDVVQAPVDPSDPSHPQATFNLQDTGDFANDGPANPGLYNVDITDRSTGAHDSCQQCFQVFSFGTLGLTGLTPNSLAAGSSTNVTFNGAAFARGTKIEFLLPGGAVDPAITVTAPTQPGSPTACAAAGQPPGCTLEIATRTTNNMMLRRVNIDTQDAVGPRDVRVTNTDGAMATCTACFTVNGAPFSSVTPASANNAPSAAPAVRITFNGPSVPQSGTPQLVFASDAGSSTKNDLTLTGTNVTYSPTSVAADFDFRNAAPGNAAYVPTLTQADGSTNSCGCTFSVAQASPATVAVLTPNSAAQSDSRTVTINGTNLSRGVQILFSGTGIDVTSVVVNGAGTQAQATIQVQSTAAAGKRDVSAKTTDGVTGPLCSGCFTVTSSASPSASSSSSSASSSPCPSGGATSSPSASPSASGTPTASGTATPSASGTATPSASASGSPSATSSPAASNCSSSRSAATLTADKVTIFAGQKAFLHGTGTPGQGYSLQCYTRPSVDYTEARSGTFDSAGNAPTFELNLGRNTRCYLRYTTNPTADQSPSVVINVKTVLSLSTVRKGVRQYEFRGRNLPRVAGQLITLYRVDDAGHEIRTSNLKTDDTGIYTVTRTFTGTGTFRFKVRTSRTSDNASGVSNTITVTVR